MKYSILDVYTFYFNGASFRHIWAYGKYLRLKSGNFIYTNNNLIYKFYEPSFLDTCIVYIKYLQHKLFE